MTAYIADRIFDGESWLEQHAILADEKYIKELVPVSALPAGIVVEQFPGCTIVPALIDLQIYGAHERLLAVYPEAASLALLNDYCRAGGAAFCLPTVATNTIEIFHRSIDAIRDYWRQGGEGILGIHLEGPWLNPVKRGAHTESLIHSPTVQEARDLLEYGNGVIRIITLAPEQCSKEVIDLILSYGVVISAGHSNATYEEAKTGFRRGIITVTHLYNAMSPLQHRAPGLAGATMDDASVMASIIPDGHHVDYAAIRIAKKVMNGRLFVITDAVTETDKGNYPHKLVGDKYEAGGILSGSALTMMKAVNNLVEHVGIEFGEAIRMCSLYPARVIGLDKELGRLLPGYHKKMLVLEKTNVSKLIG